MTTQTVLLVSQYYRPSFGGIENSLFYLGKSLKALGYNPIIVVSDHDPFCYQRLSARTIIDGVEVFRYRRWRKPRIIWAALYIQDVAQAWWLVRKLARAHEIVAIISRDHRAGLGASLALPTVPVAYVVPGISKLQDPIAYSKSIRKLRHLFTAQFVQRIIVPQNHLFQSLFIHRSDRLVAFSDSMRQQLARVFEVSLEDVTLQPPGVDTERFAPLPNRRERRRAAGIADDEFVCIGVGRLTPIKGFHLAIEAISSLRDATRISLLLVGSGPEECRLKQLARTLGIAERVRFVTNTYGPEQYYPLADTYLMTSEHESFGQTILEAMASALPVIAFRDNDVATATHEIVTHGETGLFCAYDAQDLADTILFLSAMSPDKRAAMGSAARRAVTQRYSWIKFTTKLLGLMLD